MIYFSGCFDCGLILYGCATERLLAQTEKPGRIVRNRLEQAGYDPADTLAVQVAQYDPPDKLVVQFAQELSAYLKFVYKSVVLGPSVRSLADISHLL